MVQTALILAAGSGSRRYPITRAIDKAMIPLGNRPTVDYVVEQCARAGLTKIVFIVSRYDTLLRRYYGDAIVVQKEYPWLEKEGTIAAEYVVQKNPTGLYGTGAALLAAEHALANDETFMLLGADGFVHSDHDFISDLSRAIDDGADGAILGLNLPGKQAREYGVIFHDDEAMLERIVEKPSNLDEATMYPCHILYNLLGSSVFGFIDKNRLVNGELHITNVIEEWAQHYRVKVIASEGVFLDSGRLDSWVEANNILLHHLR